MPTVTSFEAILSGFSWNGIQVAGRPTFLTYSFEQAPASYLSAGFSAEFLATFQPFDAAEQAVARQALQAWADVSGLTLFEVPGGQGDIRFGAYELAAGPEDIEDGFGFAFNPFVFNFPEGAFEAPFGGDIFIDVGSADFDTLAHEIGHALGLKHPFEDEPLLDPSLDNLRQTAMTYNQEGGPATALGALDVQAIQHLYGLQSADGSQVASWNWDAQRLLLTQGGGAGDDTIAGVGVADRILGGAGADYVMARAGADQIDGEDGADTLSGGDDADTLNGGAGNDMVDGGDGDNLMRGGDGDDHIWGLGGSDTIAGEAGADTLYAGFGFSRIDGGSGNDVLVVTSGAAAVDGGEGHDELYFQPFAFGSLNLSYATFAAAGGSFANVERIVMFGAGSADTLQGGELYDSLVGDAGADSISAAAGDDELWGDTGRDTLSGGSGDDYLEGGSGDDLLMPGSGGDIILGGTGSDTVDYSGELAGVTVLINGARLDGGFQEVMEGVENIIGTPWGDRLLGDAGANSLFGGGGSDTLEGAEGVNFLRGEDGHDSILGGSAFDDIHGNMGEDTGAGGAGNDWVVGGKDNDLLFGDQGDDIVLGNLGYDTCEGGDGADTVRGGQHEDIVRGGAGDDWLAGDRGEDTISGGAGADIFHTHGEAGVDRVLDFSRAEGDRVNLLPGTQHTASQVGSDVVIQMSGGGRMVLVGVQLSSLDAGWIFGA